MNKDILRRNIKQVITQPCLKNPMMPETSAVALHGMSKNADYILVKTTPDDTSLTVYLDKDYVQQILDSIPARYREHLVTIQHERWLSYSYVPVFDTDTQKQWDEELDKFLTAKQEWCDKYGCD